MSNLLLTTPTFFRPAGHCIYCGSSEAEGLTDEHIIPMGLDGRLVLPNASCENCSKNTSTVERFVIQKTLQPHRILAGVKGRTRPNRRAKTVQADPMSQDASGEWKLDVGATQLEIPLEGIGPFVMWPNFDPPGILSGRDPTESIATSGMILANTGVRPNLEVQTMSFSSNFNYPLFARFLAKIGHGFAYAVLRERVSRYFLPANVLGKRSTNSFYIGGMAISANPKLVNTGIHSVGLWNEVVSGASLVSVYLQLFSKFNSPVYHVVVGEML